MHDLSCTEMFDESRGYYDAKWKLYIPTFQITVVYRCYYGKKSRKSIKYRVNLQRDAVIAFVDQFGFYPTTVRCEVSFRGEIPF
jgi:hypothetical protein